MTDKPDRRYSRQMLYGPIGEHGQRKLLSQRAAIVGLGALGASAADILARAGVGKLRLIDRDILEVTNLQRQTLYTESDVEAGLPKAEAAKRRLSAVNSGIELETHIVDVTAESIEALLDDVDIVVDGTDNFETRLLLNDACLSRSIPWVYCGVIGSSIHSFPIRPHQGPCFRCYIGEAPAPGSVETCDTAGVLGPAVLVAVGLAMTEVMRILVGEETAQEMLMVDLWTRRFRSFKLPKDPQCPACAGRYDYLAGKGQGSSKLCGRDAIQIAPPKKTRIDLESLAERLRQLGEVRCNPFLLAFRPEEFEEELTVFADGRAIVKGTQEVSRARALCARFIGT